MKAETDRHQVSSEVAGTGSATSSAEQTWRTPRKAGRWELCAHMRSPGTTKGGGSDNAGEQLRTYHNNNKNDCKSVFFSSNQQKMLIPTF